MPRFFARNQADAPILGLHILLKISLLLSVEPSSITMNSKISESLVQDALHSIPQILLPVVNGPSRPTLAGINSAIIAVRDVLGDRELQLLGDEIALNRAKSEVAASAFHSPR